MAFHLEILHWMRKWTLRGERFLATFKLAAGAVISDIPSRPGWGDLAPKKGSGLGSLEEPPAWEVWRALGALFLDQIRENVTPPLTPNPEQSVIKTKSNPQIALASPNSTMTELAQEPEFAEQWERATNKLCKVCKKGRQDLKLPITIEDVLAKLGDNKSKTSEPNSKSEKAKYVLEKTVLALETLGKIAVQGVATVFGPAELVLNGVMFLVERARHFSRVFEALNNLLERISAFLERFQVYTRSLSSIDSHLKTIIGELLECFVEICCIAIELTQQSKFITFAKVFAFDHDFGIKSQLEKLEGTIARELGMTVALILESSKTTEASVTRTETSVVEMSTGMEMGFERTDKRLEDMTMDLGGMVDILESAERERQVADVNKRREETIRRALQIGPKENLAAQLEECIGNTVPGTGEWLVNRDPRFAAWADVARTGSPIFAVEAKEGYGKTYLTSTVVRHLQKRYATLPAEFQAAIAYHFFPMDSYSATDARFQTQQHGSHTIRSRRYSDLNRCLRSIIWQLTHQNRNYELSVSKRCINHEEFANTSILWERLVKTLADIDAVFFIVLDGIDNAFCEKGNPLLRILHDASVLSTQYSRLRLKFFLTGRPNVVETLSSSLGACLERMPLGVRNQDDIVSYIETSMDNMKALKNRTDPQTANLRQQIVKALVDGAAGDFVKLRYNLLDIGSQHRVSSIEETLRHAAEDRIETIGREISSLNNSLSAEDIDDLNTLLEWVIGGAGVGTPFTVETLEQVLLFKNGQKSLISLKDQISQDYSGVFSIVRELATGKSHVALRSSSLQDYFKKQRQDFETAMAENAPIHPKEMAIVRRVLKMACDEELYDKFGFEEFFSRRVSSLSNTIHIDFSTVHLRILLCLLEAIVNKGTDTHQKSFQHLLRYAYDYFCKHLVNIDLSRRSKEDSDLKRAVGPLLLRIFQDEVIIERWWFDARLFAMRSTWVEDKDVNGYVQAVIDFLKDTAAARDFSPEQKLWISRLSVYPNHDEISPLLPAILVVARRWLQTDSWKLRGSCYLLYVYMDQVSGRKTTKSLQSMTLEDIIQVERFARHSMDISDNELLPRVKVADTIREFSFYPQALEKYDEALAQHATDVLALRGKAMTHLKLEDFAETIKIAAPLKRRLDNDLECDKSLYRQVTETLATAYVGVNQFDEAMRVYRIIMELLEDNFQPMFPFMNELRKKNQPQKVTEIIEYLRSNVTTQGLSRLVTMYISYSGNHLFYEVVNWALAESNRLEVAEEAFELAIAASEHKAMFTRNLSSLRYEFGKALHHYWGTEEASKKAIQMYELNFNWGMPSTDGIVQYFCGCKTGAALGALYLEKAKEVGIMHNDAEPYIKKLEYLVSHTPSKWDKAAHQGPRILLGRLYTLAGNIELARKTLAPYVQNALDALTDDDPDNDHYGYYYLARSLMPLDEVNGAAAWSLLGHTHARLDATECNNDANRSAASEHASRPFYSCDGFCGHEWCCGSDIYVCRDCIDVGFESKCYDMFRRGELQHKSCSPSHEFLYVPPCDENMHNGEATGTVVVGGDTLNLTTWLASMRLEYACHATSA
ncbi:hypothetical protein QQS21_000793 [Conoideocrella luteorostrata]|uniref:Fungal STAND N-terminal Goodbye domain-containing protein n=1 Tax=Conoideocrella luteorostrata TaxID=1105319 RepID=A0AAJ0CYE3_9HYPO|nr:hypothetical protein QQS21_000793 [Conoideocrella luteorostrata]